MVDKASYFSSSLFCRSSSLTPSVLLFVSWIFTRSESFVTILRKSRSDFHIQTFDRGVQSSCNWFSDVREFAMDRLQKSNLLRMTWCRWIWNWNICHIEWIHDYKRPRVLWKTTINDEWLALLCIIKPYLKVWPRIIQNCCWICLHRPPGQTRRLCPSSFIRLPFHPRHRHSARHDLQLPIFPLWTLCLA